MSDETIQYITTDYLIEVDGGEPAPAPIEYIVELGQVGVQGIPGEKGEPGFSPTVGYILNDNTFRINITNQDGVTQTPNLYDYFADKNGYLKIDGSNADNDITINGIELVNGSNYANIVRAKTGLNLDLYNGGSILNDTRAYISLSTNGNANIYGDNGVNIHSYQSNIRIYSDNGKAYYGSTTAANNEIATIGDISDATITLTQGGVTKGTFTLNGSATTIDLDAGGGSITNPLAIGYTNGSVNYNLNLGVDETTTKVISSYTINTEGSTLPPYIAPIKLLTGSTNPLTLTENQDGLYNLSLNIDSDTLEVNQDGELTVIGGGGAVDSVNGQTGTVVLTASDVGALSDTTVIPTNSDYVDLTTNQTVGGTKTFSDDQYFGGYIYLDGSSNAQGVVHRVGNTRKHLVLRNNQASTVYVGNVYDALNLRGSGTRPTYYANSISKDIALTDDIPSVMVGATSSTAGTAGLVPAPAIGDEGKVLLGDGSWSSDYVTRTTNQVGTDAYITGNKQFAGTVYLSAGKVIIQNNNNTQNIGLINNTSDLQISTYSNKNIKFSPNGTGKLYYGNNEVATINDIPSLTNYVTNTDYATTSTAGIVQPDGSTITVNNGVISATPSRNIGEIVHSLVPLTDAGLHLLDGSLISGSGSYADFVTYIAGLVNDYPNLFVTEANWQTSVTTYGVCGKFVYDSTNNTVRLPKITGIIEGTVDATALGDLVEAGLPNVAGQISGLLKHNLFQGTGAFSSSELSGSVLSAYIAGSGNYQSTIQTTSIDASRSSSIYGNSSTVQPQTIKAFVYIVIATSAKTEIQVDIDEIATDLNGKADTDLSNITTVNTQITTTAKNPIINKLTNADITVAPISDIATGIMVRDNNDNNLAGFSAIRYANGIQATQMTAYNQISGTNKYAYLNVYVRPNGNDVADASAGVKATIARWAFPSNTSSALTVGASGATYRAPADGWFTYSTTNTSTQNNFTYLNNETAKLLSYSMANAGVVANGFIPVKKGDTVSLSYFSSIIASFKFVYAQGAV